MAHSSERALNLAVAAVTAIALVLGFVRIREYFDAPRLEKPRIISQWEQYGRIGHRIGPESARVTIVEFADYECGFCQAAAPVLEEILAKYPNRVALVYRHFPLTGHRFAVPAIRAVECADRFGKFQEYHKLLYEQSYRLAEGHWLQWATKAGITDTTAFGGCFRETVPIPALDRDTAAATALAIRGTPLFLINNLRVSGFPGREELLRLVEQALETTSGDEDAERSRTASIDRAHK